MTTWILLTVTVEERDKTSATFQFAYVEDVIENEIAQGCSQRQIAQTYALALRSRWPTDWSHVNAAIVKRWPKGLERIKKLAHSGKCFK